MTEGPKWWPELAGRGYGGHLYRIEADPRSDSSDLFAGRRGCALPELSSGAHDYLFPKVAQLFKEKGIDDVLILGGGIVPEEDVLKLKESGIEEIFGPGTRTDDIVEYIRTHLKK